MDYIGHAYWPLPVQDHVLRWCYCACSNFMYIHQQSSQSVYKTEVHKVRRVCALWALVHYSMFIIMIQRNYYCVVHALTWLTSWPKVHKMCNEMSSLTMGNVTGITWDDIAARQRLVDPSFSWQSLPNQSAVQLRWIRVNCISDAVDAWCNFASTAYNQLIVWKTGQVAALTCGVVWPLNC